MDQNEIKHYGVKGMHWGSRKGKSIAREVNRTEGTGLRSIGRSYLRSIGNTIRHPFVSTGVRAKNAFQHPVLSATSGFMMRKKNNKEIREELKRIKEHKKKMSIERNLIKAKKMDVKIAKKKGDYETAERERRKLDEMKSTTFDTKKLTKEQSRKIYEAKRKKLRSTSRG